MNKIDKILVQADFLRKNNWIAAVILLKKSIEEFPDSSELYLELADIYSEHKINRKAIEAYAKVYIKNENDHTLIFKIANNLLVLKEYRLALDYYYKIKQNFPELLYNKAFAYSKIGKIDMSIKLLNEIIDTYDTSESTYLFLSELYFSQKEFVEAIDCIKIAEKKYGRQSVFHYLKGAAYSHLEHWLNAYSEFREADKFNKKFPNFYRSYAICAEKIGKTDQAIELLRKNLEFEPYDSFTYIELIKIYIAHDNLIKAYEVIREALDSIPFSFPLTLLYNQIIMKIKTKYEK